ncbi:PH domain-containing protein [Mesonia aestuariivivens]|uniref:PH domain-containing protein n=1 Tax=Mesonia aestuariivivens TaxID=2796128 RepID=A0ABS6W0M4_9FLAO|nr:PH domain-containing protein [Mesonia aestuariivivens]MBW2961405.1 PH domain-containing protein [Mesonia aestuariivivens]
MNKDFSSPQKQSKIGILVIFFSVLYKFTKIFWVFGAYLLFKNLSENLIFILIGLFTILCFAITFSILSYKKFKFHIDYDQKEFVLQKGVFSTEFINISFDRIQQVYFKRSIIQRIINVYEVAIDTAGSSDKEVTIKALSKEKADALRNILMNLAVEEVTQENETVNEVKSTKQKQLEWKHRLEVLDLLKLGLTSNYLRGIWLIFLFFGTIMNELNQLKIENTYLDRGVDYLDQNYTSPSAVIFVVLVALIFTFLVGILISTVEIFIKYFNLTLTQTSLSLDLEMGLKTNTRTSLKPRRVQMLRLSTNPIQKRLDLYEAEVSLASSSDDFQKKKSKIKIPGLAKDKLKKIKEFLYKRSQETSTPIKPHSILFVRKFVLSCIPVFLAIIPIIIFAWYRWEIILPAVSIYLLLSFFLNKKYYQSISIEFTENFIVKKQGIWNHETEIIELFKLQSITVKQALWFRKRKLYHLEFHTAGGDLFFPLVSEQDLKNINYNFYKIETSTKAWM